MTSLTLPKRRIKYPTNTLTHANFNTFAVHSFLYLTSGCVDEPWSSVNNLKSGEVSDRYVLAPEKGRCEDVENCINNLLRVGDANSGFVSYLVDEFFFSHGYSLPFCGLGSWLSAEVLQHCQGEGYRGSGEAEQQFFPQVA